jgi:hypothetical protein
MQYNNAVADVGSGAGRVGLTGGSASRGWTGWVGSVVVDVRDDASGAWLWVSVSVAGSRAKLQELAWRSLGSLGAHFLEPAACVLPARPEVAEAAQRLLDEVRRGRCAAQMRRVSFRDPAAESRVIAEMNALIDAEYAEVLDRLPAFFSELEYERGRGRVIYAEVEESEVDLERFRRWMSRIASRDYFDAPNGVPARAAVESAAEALAAFEADAMGLEPPESRDSAPGGA